jgi:hypothetical protein
MNVIVPPSDVRSGGIEFCGSSTMVISPKSARHALGGVSFVIRMFAYWRIRIKPDRDTRWWPGTNPFEIPVGEARVVEILQPFHGTMQLL